MEFSPRPYSRVELLVNCTKPGCCKSLAPNVAMEFFLRNADHSVSFLPLTAWKCSRLKRQQKQNSTSRKSKPFFFSLCNPNGKKKKNSNQKEHNRVTYNKTKQNKNPQTKQSAQRASQSRWYKRKKQFANLVTPKDLID
jgi:hypothetical protein